MKLATCDKYYHIITERWPELTYKQVDKIVKKGLMSLYMCNLYGGDVLIRNNNFTMYFGKLFKSDLVFYKYWQIKWKIKLRIKYRRAKTRYDGYYYFGLTEGEFKKYKAQINKTGNRRKKFHFDKLYMYKILDEALLRREYKHIFRIKYPEDCGFTMYKENWIARDFDYILKRNKDNEIEPVSYEQTNSNKYVNRRIK